MVERQLKGLFYNCEEKYFSGHNCKEHKIFMAIYEDANAPTVKELPQADDPTPP
jgi:hypothetical protein